MARQCRYSACHGMSSTEPGIGAHPGILQSDCWMISRTWAPILLGLHVKSEEERDQEEKHKRCQWNHPGDLFQNLLTDTAFFEDHAGRTDR